MVARFQRVKGHHMFQAMAEGVLTEMPNTHFIVAGDDVPLALQPINAIATRSFRLPVQARIYGNAYTISVSVMMSNLCMPLLM